MNITNMLDSLTGNTRQRILNRHRINEGLKNAGKVYTMTASVYSMSALQIMICIRQIKQDNANENAHLREAQRIFLVDNPKST